MNRILDKIIDRAHKKLIDVEATASTKAEANNHHEKDDLEQQQQLEIGRLTHIYESNIDTLTNYLPNVPAKDLELYPDYYSEIEERANKEIKEYEELTAIAEANAATAGLANPKQYTAEFAQDCKQAYLEDWKKKEERLKHITITMHSDGTMTSLDTATGETLRLDNQFNPL
jgi:hypothetical protein